MKKIAAFLGLFVHLWRTARVVVRLWKDARKSFSRREWNVSTTVKDNVIHTHVVVDFVNQLPNDSYEVEEVNYGTE